MKDTFFVRLGHPKQFSKADLAFGRQIPIDPAKSREATTRLRFAPVIRFLFQAPEGDTLLVMVDVEENATLTSGQAPSPSELKICYVGLVRGWRILVEPGEGLP
jgi:hypothetical protein